MKRTLLIFWLLLPIVVMIWHFGPGRYHLLADRAGVHIRAAEQAAAEKDWLVMAASYADAQKELSPVAVNQRYRLALAEAQARIHGGEMAAGQNQLKELLIELKDDAGVDQELKTNIRSAFATASYYSAWRMRVEGAAQEEWMLEADQARAQFRWLAEDAVHRATNDTNVHGTAAHRQSRIFAKNLEAAIKLQQIELADLSVRPWPINCPSYLHDQIPDPQTPVVAPKDPDAG